MKQEVADALLIKRLKGYREDARLAELFPWPIVKLDVLRTLIRNSEWIDEIEASVLAELSLTAFEKRHSEGTHDNRRSGSSPFSRAS